MAVCISVMPLASVNSAARNTAYCPDHAAGMKASEPSAMTPSASVMPRL